MDDDDGIIIMMLRQQEELPRQNDKGWEGVFRGGRRCSSSLTSQSRYITPNSPDDTAGAGAW